MKKTSSQVNKIVVPVAVFLLTFLIGGVSVFVVQKVRSPKLTVEAPKEYGSLPSPTTPIPAAATSSADICTNCECTFSSYIGDLGCSLLTVSPTVGLATATFNVDLTCTSGETPFHKLYLMARKQGETTKIRLTPGNGFCEGESSCSIENFSFVPQDFSLEDGIYDLWIAAHTLGEDGQLDTADDGTCTDIPEGVTGASACGAGVRSFIVGRPTATAYPYCTGLTISPTSGGSGTTFTVNLTCYSGSAPFYKLYLMTRVQGKTGSTLLTPGNGLCYGQSTCAISDFTFTPSTSGLLDSGIYDIWIEAQTLGADGKLDTTDDTDCTDIPGGVSGVTACGAPDKTYTIVPTGTPTHQVCQNSACVEITGGGTDECETDADCVEEAANQKPSCGRLLASPTAGTAPLRVTFTANGPSDPDGTISVYEFDFGDESGSTRDENSVSHTYQTAGTYEARLWVRDNESLQSTITDFCRAEIVVASATGTTAPDADGTDTSNGGSSTGSSATGQTTTPGVGTEGETTPGAADTGTREATVALFLGGLFGILIGSFWFNKLDPSWRKFEKSLTKKR